jgi:DNA/RNA-binding domain of Phe-tRNA-synthetase-like protein
LYEVNTLVDVINLVSLRTGYSIGGFDVDKITGSLVMGIGRRDEPYEAIGRGALNIEGLPVLRDEAGAVGTPTSDEDRTKLDVTTARFLMSIYAFGGSGGLQEALEAAERSLKTYVAAYDIETAILD